MSKLFLVYGATGAQGGAVARALLARGDRVRLLTRDEQRNPFAGNAAVETVRGDLSDLNALTAASRGVDGVALVLPLNYDEASAVQWGKNAIDAAIAGKAPVLAFNTSSVVAGARTGVTAIDIKVELESYLAGRTELPSIVLRPTVYSGNLTAPWSAPAIVHQGVIAYPIPAEQRVSWLSWDEMAAYIVAALDHPELAAMKPVFRVGGADALTGPEIARTIGEALGRNMTYIAVPVDQFAAGLNVAFGEPVGTEIGRFYEWMTDQSQGNPLAVDLSHVRAVLPVPQQSFAAWAHSVPWRTLAGEATAK